jgi:pteridine reductase
MASGTPVALVTGGARRIGAEICRTLHNAGYRIALHYRSSSAAARELAEELNAERPGSCRAYGAELQHEGQCAGLAARVLEDFQRVDLLVNNASAFFKTPLASCTEADWDLLLDTNLKAPFFLVQSLAPSLRARSGSVVNIVDAHTDAPQANYTAYTTSKHGLANLTRSLAAELAPGVRVNAVAPGAILWPGETGEGLDTAEKQAALARIPLQRLGECEDIANAVVFLAGAPYITGQILAVDGGVSLNPHPPPK